jgi:hypothetical protein
MNLRQLRLRRCTAAPLLRDGHFWNALNSFWVADLTAATRGSVQALAGDRDNYSRLRS